MAGENLPLKAGEPSSQSHLERKPSGAGGPRWAAGPLGAGGPLWAAGPLGVAAGPLRTLGRLLPAPAKEGLLLNEAAESSESEYNPASLL